MTPDRLCPRCGSDDCKRNGLTHYGKQNYRCKPCGRQFALNVDHRRITDAERDLVKRLLAERLLLRGIGRAAQVSLRWLIRFAVQCYQAAPDDLNFQLPEQPDDIIVQRLEVQADEAWGFVGKKANPRWLWLALDARTRQVMAFFVGDRSRKSARKLWKKIPARYREQATFYTDGNASYCGVIPPALHQVITKKRRATNRLERLNGTLRQRVSRLVRAFTACLRPGSYPPRPGSIEIGHSVLA